MPLPRLVVITLLASVVIGSVTLAAADDTIPGHAIDRTATGAVIAGAVGLGLGLSLIPVHVHRGLWAHELFGDADDAVHTSFSLRAADLSDGLLASSIAAPVAYLAGDTIEDADGDRWLIYGEALAVNFAVFEGVKHLVQRPRPYLYARSPEATEYAAAQGDDAYQSFYSAHAATAFCAATAGAYLTAVSSTSPGVRALAWGSGFAAAAAVANLRVRAGKHFYSDVVIGAAVGIAIGYVVPALQADHQPYVPSLGDVGAAAAGVLGGGVLSELLPIDRRRSDPRRRGRLAALRRAHLHLGPAPIAHGAGVGLGGTL